MDFAIGAGVVVAILVVFATARAIGRASARAEFSRREAGVLSADEAERIAGERFEVVCRQMADPLGSGISEKERDDAVELAVACAERISQLEGGPIGPGFRSAMRLKIVRRARDVAERIAMHAER